MKKNGLNMMRDKLGLFGEDTKDQVLNFRFINLDAPKQS